jgi:hypothetical protein
MKELEIDIKNRWIIIICIISKLHESLVPCMCVNLKYESLGTVDVEETCRDRHLDRRIPFPLGLLGLTTSLVRRHHWTDIELNWRVLIATCKQLVWSIRIGRNMPIWVLLLSLEEYWQLTHDNFVSFGPVPPHTRDWILIVVFTDSLTEPRAS